MEEKKPFNIGFKEVVVAGVQVLLQYAVLGVALGLGTYYLVEAWYTYEPHMSLIALLWFLYGLAFVDMLDSRAKIKLDVVEYNLLVDKSNDLVAKLQRKIALLESRVNKPKEVE
jgi:hypothetical protein